MGRPGEWKEGPLPRCLHRVRPECLQAEEWLHPGRLPGKTATSWLCLPLPPSTWSGHASCFLSGLVGHPLPPRACLWPCLVAEQGALCKCQAGETDDPKLPGNLFISFPGGSFRPPRAGLELETKEENLGLGWSPWSPPQVSIGCLLAQASVPAPRAHPPHLLCPFPPVPSRACLLCPAPVTLVKAPVLMPRLCPGFGVPFLLPDCGTEPTPQVLPPPVFPSAAVHSSSTQV